MSIIRNRNDGQRQQDGSRCRCYGKGDLGMTMTVGNVQWIGLRTDYADLDNKPSINGKVLEGEMQLSDIGALTEPEVQILVEQYVRENHVGELDDADFERIVSMMQSRYGMTDEQVRETLEQAVASGSD